MTTRPIVGKNWLIKEPIGFITTLILFSLIPWKWKEGIRALHYWQSVVRKALFSTKPKMSTLTDYINLKCELFQKINSLQAQLQTIKDKKKKDRRREKLAPSYKKSNKFQN